MQKEILKFKVKFLFLLLAFVLRVTESRTFNFVAVWFRRPYKGPECVVEIMGADLEKMANNRLDWWSKPDVMVKCTHDRWERCTQIEGNTFNPRFFCLAKMPWTKEKGFLFTVYDANVVAENEVIGRTFINAKKAKELINSEESALLSIGEGIGFLKVNLFKAPVTLREKIQDVTDSVQLIDPPPARALQENPTRQKFCTACEEITPRR